MLSGRHAGIALKGGRGLRDRTHVRHVMIAAGEQGGARRRAERRGMKLVEAQALR